MKTEANVIIMDIKSDAFYLELTESGDIIHKYVGLILYLCLGDKCKRYALIS